jgi:transcriptional regulator with XRE-family HTH domain
MGRTQRQMADLLGVSLKSVESYEQGRRHIPANIQRILYFMLFKANWQRIGRGRPCWIDRKCPDSVRADCLAWITREGLFCWFLTGKLCRSAKEQSRGAPSSCFECDFFKSKLKQITR